MEVHWFVLYGVLLASLVFHEAAHALTAKWGGDETAYLGGQLTLNPIPHIKREPLGTVIVPIVLIVQSGGTMCMGWAHVPIDANWAYLNPRKAALMSAAGPISNFVLVLITFAVVKVLILFDLMKVVSTTKSTWFEVFAPVDGASGGVMSVVCLTCVFLIMLNLLLGFLNLLPIPPLDGAGVVSGLFPKQTRGFYERLRHPMAGLLIFAGLIYLFWFAGAGTFVIREILIPVFNFFIETLLL